MGALRFKYGRRNKKLDSRKGVNPVECMTLTCAPVKTQIETALDVIISLI